MKTNTQSKIYNEFLDQKQNTKNKIPKTFIKSLINNKTNYVNIKNTSI